jgi:hypothetical protein
LGMNHVIMANHMISLITSSTTDPRITPTLVVFQIYKIEIHKIKINTYIPFDQYILYREYYMALSVSHPVSTRDTNIIPRALADMQISFI